MSDGLTPEEVAQFQEWGRTGLLSVIENIAKRLTAPFYWYHPHREVGAQILGGGTICFVQTGEALLGISAAHVHRKCVEELAADPVLTCEIGSHIFDPEARLVDIDDKLDMVTYGLSQIQVNGARAYVHSPREWPPVANSEDFVMVAGWPWRMIQEKEAESTHDFLNFIGRLNVNSDTHLGMRTFKSSSVPWGKRTLPPGLNLGGMSGGPVYGIRPERLQVGELIGVIYEYGIALEQVLARPMSRVAANGTLIR